MEMKRRVAGDIEEGYGTTSPHHQPIIPFRPTARRKAYAAKVNGTEEQVERADVVAGAEPGLHVRGTSLPVAACKVVAFAASAAVQVKRKSARQGVYAWSSQIQ